MFLINAIYFNGSWQLAFDPDDTQDASFHLADGDESIVKMMMMTEDSLRYHETETYQAVDLLYGDGTFSMAVVLPKGDATPASFIELLDSEMWNQWTSDFQVQKIGLRLPKFKIEWESSLVDALSSLGMGVAFDSDLADFSRLSAEQLYISGVTQKTFVDVHEKGTEAAAVTVVTMAMTSVGPSYPIMRVDRPFLFAIRERSSGALLFVGKMMDPAAAP